MIELSSAGDATVVANLRSVGPRLRNALAQAMNRIGIILAAYIVSEKLQGQALKHRTGKLGRSIRNSVEQSGDTVAALVQGGGAFAPYGVIHEDGGTFQIPDHMSTSKLGKSFLVRAHQATFPERSFMRSSLAENRQLFVDQIEFAVAESITAQ